MKGPLTLASALSTLSASELRLLLERRFEREPKDIGDHVGLALQLLRPDSIERALSRLQREQLTQLLVLGRTIKAQSVKTGSGLSPQERSELLCWGVIGVDRDTAVALPEVTEALDQQLTKHNINLTEHSDSADLADVSPSTAPEENWQHTAFLATQQAVLMLRLLDSVPAKLGRNGAVALVARKQLGERVQASPETVGHLLTVLQTAGFAVAAEDSSRPADTQWLVPSSEAPRWSNQDHPQRWLELSTRVLATMPSTLRDSAQGASSLEFAAHTVMPRVYPLLSDTERNRAQEFLLLTNAIAVTSLGVFTPPAALLVAPEPQQAEALQIAKSAFPQLAEGVYIQPDLSIIAPGPLNPQDGLQLLEVAEVTAPGIAARLEINESSLSRALDTGWSIEQVRELLSKLSLTGIPQPLDFLLSDMGERHGTLTVRPLDERQSWTLIVPVDRQMSEALLVDSRLKQLSLTRRAAEDESLVSRVSSEHVHSILVGARYPATLERHSPQLDQLEQVISTIETPQETNASDWMSELADHLSSTDHGPSKSSMMQLIKLAIRTRAVLHVTAEARGSSQTFSLLPLSLSAGRMRALDQTADLERTLPLSAITAIEAVV